jgi:hypothetical protein
MSVRESISKVHGIARRSARLYPRPLYDYEFAKLDKRPNFWDLVFSSAVTLYFLFLDSATGSSTVNPFKRFAAERERMTNLYQAFRVAPRASPSSSELASGTPLRVLYAAHPKDFDVLPHSLASVARRTRNKIDEVVIITPDPDGAEQALENVARGLNCKFIHEDDLVSAGARSMLKRTFGPRYGWALQQFLKVFGVLQNDELPTLIVDSDTVFFRDRTWVDGTTQLLYFRGFNDSSYYDFLFEWNGFRADRSKSFVTHYQLMQPEVLRMALLYFFQTVSQDRIVQIVCQSADSLGSLSFCVEYEPYGQFIYRFMPERYALDKYSNIGLERSRADFGKMHEEAWIFPYSSASFHHYLDGK